MNTGASSNETKREQGSIKPQPAKLNTIWQDAHLLIFMWKYIENTMKHIKYHCPHYDDAKSKKQSIND